MVMMPKHHQPSVKPSLHHSPWCRSTTGRPPIQVIIIIIIIIIVE